MAVLVDKIYNLVIGYEGENISRTVEFDMSDWDAMFPNVIYTILYKPYGVDEPVPVLTDYQDGILTWTPTSSVTAVAGVGYTEVRAIDIDTGLVRKSRIIPTSVENSVSGASDETPPLYEDWVNNVIALSNGASVDRILAEQARDRAEQAAIEHGYVDLWINDSGHLIYDKTSEEETIRTDLGPVSAWAIAKRHDYTGTEEDYAKSVFDAEAYAVGTRGGDAVESTDATYHNNSKYYAEQAGAAKTAAETAQTAAETAAERDTQAWLSEHITNPSSPPLDRTLSSNVSAAPADMVGSLMSAFDVSIDNEHSFMYGGDAFGIASKDWIMNQRLTSYKTVDGNKVPLTSDYNGFKYCVVDITDTKYKYIKSKGFFDANTHGTYSVFVVTNTEGILPSTTAVKSIADILNESFPTWMTKDENGYIINIDGLRAAYSNYTLGYIYFGECYYENTVEWYYYETVYGLDGLNDIQTDLHNIVPPFFKATPKVAEILPVTSYPGMILNGYKSSSDKSPNLVVSNSFNTICIDINKVGEGTIYAQQPYNCGTSASNHTTLFVCDTDNHWLFSVGFKETSYNSHGITYSRAETPLSIDIATLKSEYQTVRYLYSCQEKNNMFDLYGNGVVTTILPTWFPDATEIPLIKNDIQTLQELDAVYLDLPFHSTAVVGHQWNMYKRDVVRCSTPERYEMKLYIPQLNGNYIQWNWYEEVSRFTPTAANVGNRTCTVDVMDKLTGKIVASGSFILRVVTDTAYTGKKVMFIGDSLTEASIYPAEIQFNLSNEGIESVGTLTYNPSFGNQQYTVRDEGRAGWSAGDYCNGYTKAGDTQHTNAFWNTTTEKFDFAYYMANNNVSNPDIVCIGLGTNGDATVSDTVGYVEEMITSIHAYDSSIPVLVTLINYGCDQNGWGTRGTSSAWSFMRRVYNTHVAYREAFGNRNDKVDLIELYQNIDLQYDFGTTTVPVSERNPVTVTIQNNTEHPNAYGYLKFADVYYANILYTLANMN